MLAISKGPEINSSDLSIMQLQDAVEAICDYATERARPPIACSGGKPILTELLQDPAFLQRFVIGLAQGVARLLAAYDEQVLAVYFFQKNARSVPLPKGVFCPDVTIRLLVLVKRRSAALDALATAVDQALLDRMAKLPASSLSQRSSLLNPIFITEADVAKNEGYAVLLSSAFTPPLTIWKRLRGEE